MGEKIYVHGDYRPLDLEEQAEVVSSAVADFEVSDRLAQTLSHDLARVLENAYDMPRRSLLSKNPDPSGWYEAIGREKVKFAVSAVYRAQSDSYDVEIVSEAPSMRGRRALYEVFQEALLDATSSVTAYRAWLNRVSTSIMILVDSGIAVGLRNEAREELKGLGVKERPLRNDPKIFDAHGFHSAVVTPEEEQAAIESIRKAIQ